MEVSNKQVWDSEEYIFLPLVTELLSIKVTSSKGRVASAGVRYGGDELHRLRLHGHMVFVCSQRQIFISSLKLTTRVVSARFGRSDPWGLWCLGDGAEEPGQSRGGGQCVL